MRLAGIVLSTSYTLTIWNKFYYNPHFIVSETKAKIKQPRYSKT